MSTYPRPSAHHHRHCRRRRWWSYHPTVITRLGVCSCRRRRQLSARGGCSDADSTHPSPRGVRRSNSRSISPVVVVVVVVVVLSSSLCHRRRSRLSDHLWWRVVDVPTDRRQYHQHPTHPQVYTEYPPPPFPLPSTHHHHHHRRRRRRSEPSSCSPHEVASHLLPLHPPRRRRRRRRWWCRYHPVGTNDGEDCRRC